MSSKSIPLSEKDMHVVGMNCRFCHTFIGTLVTPEEKVLDILSMKKDDEYLVFPMCKKCYILMQSYGESRVSMQEEMK